ncbi:MAG: site-2 protease family protein, partial [Oscillospiraceae bacterium]
IESVLMIAAFISISIGMFNLLPFPALDGGKLVLLVIELITKKAIPKKVEAIINAVGLLLLLGLMVAVTFKDIFFLFRR